MQSKKQALVALNAGLNYCTANTWNDALNENPPIQQIICTKEAIGLWKLKLSWHRQQHQAKQALEVVFKLDSLIDKIRLESLSETNQLFWTSELANLYQEGMKISYELGAAHTATAFYFAEKSKNFVLYSTLKKNQYEDNIPSIKPLLEEKARLQQSLYYLTQKLNSSFTDKKTLITELNTTKIALLNTQALIKAKYPKYDKLVSNLKVETVDNIQAKISEKEAVVEYARLDSFVLAFVICKDSFRMIKLANLPDSLIIAFKKHIENPAIHSKVYLPLAYQFYQTWVQPIEKYAHQSNWLVIRDGLLNYLPFEAFVTQNTATDDFKNVRFLVYDKAIAYHYSLTLWQYLQEKPSDEKPQANYFLTVIDDYQGNRNLQQLSHADKLVNSIHQNLPDGTTVPKIKKTQFMSYFTPKVSKHYPLICLYTHALANDNQPDSSWIAFYEANLYVSEILQLDLSTDLLMLGSCQSGTGKLQKGEGVMSLSRAFIYAGVKNILSMQWDMDSDAGSEILSYTILNLSQKQPKNIALQGAKKQYLTQHKQELQPYFWATPYLIGDTQSLPFESNTYPSKSSYPYVWFLFIFLLLGSLGYFFWKKYR